MDKQEEQCSNETCTDAAAWRLVLTFRDSAGEIAAHGLTSIELCEMCRDTFNLEKDVLTASETENLKEVFSELGFDVDTLRTAYAFIAKGQ